MGMDKLLAEHRQRPAFVYVRQSTMAQVLKHQTSTDRQRGLAKLAVELGWAPTQVEVLMGDLGSSGKFADDREGFQRLVTEVTLGRVGAIFSTEVSRLARSSADWQRLIEVAGLTRTVLADEQTVYDPRDPNDRLVLGMKGTMAEFELVWLRQRMDEGKRHLARQGRLRFKPPVGYVYDGDRLVLDPDEEVRRAVNQLFERYRASGSCLDVVRFFHEQGLRFPTHPAGTLLWGRLGRSQVHRMVTNPRYAGAYVHGRTRTEAVLEEGRRRQQRRKVAQSDWPVILQAAHPAYVTWEEFMANQKRLSENRPSREGAPSRGAAGSGGALLQGLLLCGRCGSRLTVSYKGTGGRYPIYMCCRRHLDGTGKACAVLMSRFIDQPVVEVALGALTREELEAGPKVAELLEQEDEAVEQQWKLRLDRARYEAKRAERQYNACEPENRVVARTLEGRWNDALVELDKLEREHQELSQRRRAELTELDRRRIAELSSDLPRLWRAGTTTDRDRKMLLRILLKDICVTAIEVPRRALRLRILWHTQAITEVEVDRPRPGSRNAPLTWRVVGTTTSTTSEAVS